MPFVESRTSSSGPTPIRLTDLADPGIELPIWVNVSSKVGEGLRHQRSLDTLWVQFIIKRIFDGPGMFKLVRPLAVDGKYGDDTKAWIRHFQQDSTAQSLAQNGSASGGVIINAHVDAAVSRVPPGAFLTRAGFTAYKLNKALAVLEPMFFLGLTNSARSAVTLEAFIKANP